MPSLRALLPLSLLLSSCEPHPPPPEPPRIPAAQIEVDKPRVRFVTDTVPPPGASRPADPASGAGGASGSPGKMSSADCDKIFDRYFELLLGSDAAGVAPDARKDAMRTAKAAIAGDPNLAKAKQACLTELTPDKYSCAMGASSVDAWQGCLK